MTHSGQRGLPIFARVPDGALGHEQTGLPVLSIYEVSAVIVT